MKEITEEEAREFIAKLAGWTHYGCTGCGRIPCRCNDWLSADAGPSKLPDYFNDADREALFWMHQAEKTLDRQQCSFYHDLLTQCCVPHRECAETGQWSGRWSFGASASNRANCFLEVHGYKLKETK